MSRSTIIFAAAAMALAGCTAQPTANAASGAPAGRQCFHASTVNGFSAVDDNALDVQVGTNRYYRFDLVGVCPDIDWTETLALRTTAGSAWICAGADAEIIVPNRITGPQRCLVTSVRPISRDEYRAKPKN